MIKMLSVTAGYVIIAGAGLSVAISMYQKACETVTGYSNGVIEFRSKYSLVFTSNVALVDTLHPAKGL
jgi:hypothetical protein